MTDQGPIEYVGRKKLRPPKQPKQRPAQPSAPAAAEDQRTGRPPRKSSRWGWLQALLVFAGIVAAFIAYAFLGRILRPAYVAAACNLSACSTGGMVVAGWLVIALPALLIGASVIVESRATIARRQGRTEQVRAGRTTRRVLLGLTIAAVLMALTFVPGRRRNDLSDLVKGPGADQFIDGLMWGLAGVGAALAMMALLGAIGRKAPAVRRHYAVISAALGTMLLVAAFPVAVSNTYSTATTAEEIFPVVLEMNDDVLTRTATANQRGCDGVLPDDSLLHVENCILSLRVAYRTDDSDAVADLWAVLYTSNDAARAVRAALPSASSDTRIAVYSTTQSWLLLGTAAHADGSTIAKADRAWVVWPLRQVAYRFIGFHNGLLIDPDPGDEVHPRGVAG
ncbi:MAG: hypothetical protein HOU81_05850 [Hamadaea sp.]|nr:hypothetical protein [Hamadaea sp.]